MPVQANFSDAETVLTQPYFNQARQMAERAIESVDGRVKVFNCSDGALVRGAEPLRAEQIALRAYDKQADIDLIRSSFRPLRAGEDWEPFPMAGEQLLSLYKKGLLNELKMKKFNWFKFAKIVDSIDHMVLKRLPRKSVVEGDMRLEPYMEVVRELLIMWYRFLCFGNNEHEWQQVYEVGYQELAALIEDMHWDDL
ncbi:hypothetical protein [Malonomonas rubra]|uniref:hypothetical protein n=1 Tax=Malonomonas rubra TaxID=57040 RepID=UPI0026EC600A|nr:hypothetical protein [Malonomonas rubra]